jgi:4-hydroxy-3-polyprenylbenzoate decarboxylase
LVSEVKSIKQYKTHTKTPVVVLAIDKYRATKELYEALKPLCEHMKLLVFIDSDSNDLENVYMLVWRVVNNIDAIRDIYLEKGYIGIDATNKSALDGYAREWPKDTDCDPKIISDLQERGLITKNREFLNKYHV